MVGVLTRHRMCKGPFQALLCGENGGAVTGSQGDQLSTLCDPCSTTTRGIAVSCDGAADVCSVARRGVGVPGLGPSNAVKLCGVNHLLSRPWFQIIEIGMTGIHTSIKVHDGGSVAVPFGEGQVDFSHHLAVGLDDGSCPSISGSNDVGGFVHQDASVTRVSAPFRWQVKEVKRFIQFQVFNAVPQGKLSDGLDSSLDQATVNEGSLANEVQTDVFHGGLVRYAHG